MSERLDVAVTDFGGEGLPLLVLGPALGAAVTTLWNGAAGRLTSEFHVLGWDLPGHGRAPAATEFAVDDLAAAVLAAVPGPFHYAGVSLGGAVGQQLMLTAPDRVTRATLLSTGPRIATPEAWAERAALVRARGTEALVEATPQRWFAPANRESDAAKAPLQELPTIDAESYAAACAALGRFDVRSRLHEITAPVLAVAGGHDPVTTVADLRHLADGVQHGRLVVLDDCSHQLPAEAPDRVAALIGGQPGVDPRSTGSLAQVRAEGMRVRREVLGDTYVDAASGAADEFTAQFQQFITSHAWGTVWTRPGLDRRSRSLITLTALVAQRQHDELALHLRAALRNGVTREEITELLLQTAIYCGVPAANAAFRVARGVLAEERPS